VELRDSEESFCFTVKVMGITLQLVAQNINFMLGYANIVNSSLPAGIAPTLKIFIDPLACLAGQA
jgi:hypothetical protein